MADHRESASETDAAASPALVLHDELVTVTVRRSPKYAAFLTVGAALGVLVALILTFAFHGTASQSPNTSVVYTLDQVFGFLALIGATVGVLVGGVTALLLDRALERRTHRVAADREHARQM